MLDNKAARTKLGQFFLKRGFSFCCLPIFKGKRKNDTEIIIS